MITFVNDGESLFGEKFFVSLDIQSLPHDLFKYTHNIASYFVSEFHYKKGFGIEDISQWKITRDNVGIQTFENAIGKKFALRFDIFQNALAKFGREKFGNMFGAGKPHVFIPYAEEVQRRGVDIENAVGFLSIASREEPDKKKFFVIVEVVPNATKIGEITRDTLFQMGQILSQVHQAGIIHGHPHLGNWVVVDGIPRLVDGKGVGLDFDFPWHTCSGGVHTFQNMASNDCAHVLGGELGTVSENFDAFNDGYRTT